MVDESPIPVQTSEKQGKTHTGYQWIYYSPHEKIVCFDYQKTRGREGPLIFLKIFIGAIQSDGYAVYNYFEILENIHLLACMAHARRKFEQALGNNKELAEHALSVFQKLYSIERQARESNLNYEEIRKLRIEKSVPILEEFEKWLKEKSIEVLPQSSIGKAISYTLNLWKRLIRYTENGKYQIDNNLVENSIRPMALGRKNYLFAGSNGAAQRAAMMYSFFGTCKINNINPLEWLTHALKVIPDSKLSKLEELLPQNFSKQ